MSSAQSHKTFFVVIYTVRIIKPHPSLIFVGKAGGVRGGVRQSQAPCDAMFYKIEPAKNRSWDQISGGGGIKAKSIYSDCFFKSY
jgi:hypothetical protein